MLHIRRIHEGAVTAVEPGGQAEAMHAPGFVWVDVAGAPRRALRRRDR